MSRRCDHECAIHKPQLGELRAVSLMAGGMIHASVQGEPATLCGLYIPYYPDEVDCGWWGNHTRNMCKRCCKGGIRLP